MVLVKIRADSNIKYNDNLIFFTLYAGDRQNIARKITEQLQTILLETGEGSTYYDMIIELSQWCSKEFGEKPVIVSDEEIQNIDIQFSSVFCLHFFTLLSKIILPTIQWKETFKLLNLTKKSLFWWLAITSIIARLWAIVNI